MPYSPGAPVEALHHVDTTSNSGNNTPLYDLLPGCSLREVRDSLQSRHKAIRVAHQEATIGLQERQLRNCNPYAISELLCGDPTSRAKERGELAILGATICAHACEKESLREEIALLNGQIAVEAGFAKGKSPQFPED